MIYHPDHIIDFGRNKGYSIKQIYQFIPSYISWLVKYEEGFEINPKEFLALPNPTPFNRTYPTEYVMPSGKTAIINWHKNEDFSVNAAIKYLEEVGPIAESNFTFSNEVLEILRQKSERIYNTPKWDKGEIYHLENGDLVRKNYQPKDDWKNINCILNKWRESLQYAPYYYTDNSGIVVLDENGSFVFDTTRIDKWEGKSIQNLNFFKQIGFPISWEIVEKLSFQERDIIWRQQVEIYSRFKTSRFVYIDRRAEMNGRFNTLARLIIKASNDL